MEKLTNLSILVKDNQQKLNLDLNESPIQWANELCIQNNINLQCTTIVCQNLLRKITEQFQIIKQQNKEGQLLNIQVQCFLHELLGETQNELKASSTLYERSLLQENKKQQFIEYERRKQDEYLSKQCTFNPKFISKENYLPQFNRSENLYILGKEKQLKRNKSIEPLTKMDIIDENCTFQPQIRRLKNQQHSTKLSQCLYNYQERQLRKWQYLFNLMDNNNDGIISKNYIDISKINQEQLTELMPILLKIEQEDLNINFEQFIQLLRI